MKINLRFIRRIPPAIAHSQFPKTILYICNDLLRELLRSFIHEHRQQYFTRRFGAVMYKVSLGGGIAAADRAY